MPIIPKNIAQINQNIQEAITLSSFDEKVTLVAVSKGQPFTNIVKAFDAGIINFGENYLQEALDKKSHLEKLAIQWHFLGPIQSNK
ncbi:MAG: YggS family pyridoxal phosphate enzyme, partial [Candidatus Methylopumilus sp.]|nr:YggS family pyridoxal phosphate enzyme [Candidatus Methylopumilus sp.]